MMPYQNMHREEQRYRVEQLRRNPSTHRNRSASQGLGWGARPLHALAHAMARVADRIHEATERDTTRTVDRA